MDEEDLHDRVGSVKELHDGSDLVLTWLDDGEDEGTEMLRFNPASNTLRIFPKIRRIGIFEEQFDQLVEIHIEADLLPRWDPDSHSKEGDRYGLLHVVGLPKGFSATYDFGLGVKREYRGLLYEVEERSPCTVVRFGTSDNEGPDGNVFRLGLERFERYRAAVDRNRGRGNTAVRRVNVAEQRNALADLLHVEPVEPTYGKNPVIRAITEEVAKGYVMDADDRAMLVEQVVAEAPKVAHEAPAQFGRLRHDLELVSLEVLIARFEEGLNGSAANREAHWQSFFRHNPFALQQLFSAPVVLYGDQLHVKSGNAFGQGARIADFVCVNTVTHSALVVEIKTPATSLAPEKPYRGNGGAEVFPPHRDLTGAVMQVQAQMESMHRHFPKILEDSPGLGAIDPYDVRGAVIAGQVEKLTKEQRESFQRYRNGLAMVTVLGYDEVCERLKALHSMLKAPPQSADDVVRPTAVCT